MSKHQGWSCLPGDVWQSSDIFLVVTANREAAKHPMFGQLTTAKGYPAQNVTSAKAEKLWSGQRAVLYCPIRRLHRGGQEARQGGGYGIIQGQGSELRQGRGDQHR